MSIWHDYALFKELFLSDTVWTDFRVPVTQTKRGSNNLPAFDETNIGYTMKPNSADEIIYIIIQFPHEKKCASNIKPHLHYIQNQATPPTFKMDYRWYKNGSSVPGTWTTLSTVTHVFPYTTGSILQIASFPEINGSAFDTVSSMMDIRLYRDDAVTGNFILKEFDIHFQIDALGSRQEFIK